MNTALRKGLRLTLVVVALILLGRAMKILSDQILAPFASMLVVDQHPSLLGYVCVLATISAYVTFALLTWGLSSKALGLPFRDD